MNRLCQLFVPATFVLGMVSPVHAGDAPAIPLAGPLSMDTLLSTDRAGLEALYRSAEPGGMPYGPFDGRAIPAPGTRKNLRKSRLIGILWKGKEFPGDGTMVNRVAFGGHAVRADMFMGQSWLDGGPSIILDYANTSRIFRKARDEMREVSPGLYLGATYVRTRSEPKIVYFYTVQSKTF